MADSTPAITWQIVSQIEGTGRQEGGGFVQGVTVGFTTSNGHAGSVFVPKSSYTPDNVRALVQGQVELMNRVGSLKGTA